MTVVVLVAAVCATVFLGHGVLGVAFLSDDVALVTWGREAVGPAFWKPWLGNRLTGEAGSPPYYRPLTLLSHGCDAALWGWTPSGHRLTNLLLHFGNTLLVFALVRVALPDRPGALAFWTALLFAMHPAHETAVWWISCRMELLCAFFYLASVTLFGVFMTKRSGWLLLLSVLSGVLAFTAKEMAYTLPCIWFGLALLKTDAPSPRSRLRAAVVCTLPMLFVAAGFMALRLTRMPAENTLFALDVTPGHVLTVARLAVRYLVFPFHLSLRELVREHPWGVLAALAVLASLFWPLRRRLFSLPAGAGMAWMIVTALVLIRTMSPWTLYLPSVGFCLALAGCAPTGPGRREWTAAVAMLAVLFAYTLQLETRKTAWKETDRVTRAFIDDFRHAVAAEGMHDPVVLCVPGAVADVPALLHYFEMRMRLETGRQDLDPAVLAYVMLPAEPARRGIAVEKADAASWRVTPADPATTFLFPHKGYEFQQYPSDTLIEMPWGLVTLRGDNVAGELTALDVRPNSAAIEAWRERKWYAFDGEHLVALPREFARSNGDTQSRRVRIESRRD
ncbi:MAG TPA: hypothetical protein PK729_17520, partial [Candidatus Hydrogenedentes bacterium]|nr:hypothetical protein [Candidatus Hydrogenedentota bacterium]